MTSGISAHANGLVYIGVGAGCYDNAANAWLSDTFIDLGRQVSGHAQPALPWVFMNILAFSWAIALCAPAMFATAILAATFFGSLDWAISWDVDDDALPRRR